MPIGQYLPSSDTNSSMQRNLDDSGLAVLASYGLLGAILMFGGAGFVLDRWLGTAPWLLIGGLLVGVSVGFYLLGRLVVRH